LSATCQSLDVSSIRARRWCAFPTIGAMERSRLQDQGPLRFVGLGDSLTQGVGDPRPGRAGFSGELEGWVSYFASAVRFSGRTVDVRNYAAAGARLHDVLETQLDVALAEPADMISCFIGINDLWYDDLDFEVFAQRFDVLCQRLTSHAAVVITASIHDVFAPFPVRAAHRDKLAQKIARINDVIVTAAQHHGLVLLDLAARPEMFTSSVRAVDRLHPNRYGHQLIAAEVVSLLHEKGHLMSVTPPLASPSRRGVPDLAHVAWVSGYVRQNWKRWRAESTASGSTE
jgi:lysophospholipase L1-like esterase